MPGSAQPASVTALFDSYDEASEAVATLEAAGIQPGEISIISNKIENHYGDMADKAGAASVAADGAGLGSLAGAGVGLLAGLGIVSVPGIGPVLAAGWLVTTAMAAATGAVAGGLAGGLVGALTRAGIDDADANVYAESVRRGGTLVSVRCDAARIATAEEILRARNTIDVEDRAALFRDTGWRHFDPAGRAESEEERVRARQDPRMPVL